VKDGYEMIVRQGGVIQRKRGGAFSKMRRAGWGSFFPALSTEKSGKDGASGKHRKFM
jgi:hypothetical protein